MLRPRLVQRLNEGLAAGRRLTLISAPAGFGKSMCAGEWAACLGRQPLAWLSLDAADNDPGRFFIYFIAALQKLDPAPAFQAWAPKSPACCKPGSCPRPSWSAPA